MTMQQDKARYAVIFHAVIRQLNDDYKDLAGQLRHLALSEYGCLDFQACCDGEREIAVSYWSSLEQIAVWKNDPLHLRAQQLGRTTWYHSYRVEIVELLRDYSS